MAKFLLSDIFIGNYDLSQKWGARPEVYAQFGQAGHNGWDYLMPNGTQIVAPDDGVCILVAEERKNGELVGFGRYCKILHEQNGEYFVTVYAHLQSVEVTKGQVVKKFQLIAKSDNNGFSSAPHLHFGIYLSDAQGNKIETNTYGGYHNPADKTVFEWKIENPSKPYEPTISETMGITDDAKRALDLLEKFRQSAQPPHGNLEGAINALLGASRDLASAQKDRNDLIKKCDDLKNELIDRDSYISGQDTTIKTLQKQQLELADLLGVANDYPIINGEITKLITVEDTNTILRAQLKSLKDSQGNEIGKILLEWEQKVKEKDKVIEDLITENTKLRSKRTLDKFTDWEKIIVGVTTIAKKISSLPRGTITKIFKGIASIFKKIFHRGGENK